MEVKPGYKQTEVGVIPEEWEVKRLGEVVDTDPENLGGETRPDFTFNYIALEDVDRGFLRGHAEQVFENAPSRARRKLRPNDVLVSTVRPNLQSHLLFGGEAGLWVCSTGFCVVRCREGITHPGYVLLHFFAHCVNHQIDALLTGSNYPAINSGDVRALQIPYPDYPEQRAIATALSDVDGLLGGLDRLIAKKRDLKQAAMQQLLTGQTRLPGFHGEWEVKPLGELIFRLKKTTRPSSSGRAEGAYPFFTNTTKPVDKFLDEADFDTEAIIANTGGEAYFNYYNGNFAAMADCFVFKASLVTLFLYYFLKSVERAVNDNGFTGSGIKHLDKKFFYQMEVRCPAELPEQTAIAEVLTEMDAELAALEQRREKTRALKQAMMQELLTGKIRLL